VSGQSEQQGPRHAYLALPPDRTLLKQHGKRMKKLEHKITERSFSEKSGARRIEFAETQVAQ
jgi:hypothetical protein